MLCQTPFQWRRFVGFLLIMTIISTSFASTPGSAAKPDSPNPQACLANLIPKPESVVPGNGAFCLTPETKIFICPENLELMGIGNFLAERLYPATGLKPAVVPISASAPIPEGNIYLAMAEEDSTLGEEGYRHTITAKQVTLNACRPAGIFHGVQTLRQLLPPTVELATLQPGPWNLAAVTITDRPRFAWRGAMLDLARHFFDAGEVKRYIDRLAYYKLNRLHLHLTDDQGWRIAIQSWPNLALHGGSTAVGGDRGGYFTAEAYKDIVSYAQSRYITVVPEIDMPGHTNAALASYPELNKNGVAPPLYTGIKVGFSTLAFNKEVTYKFLDDVIGELAALTPGPYLHIGGDEALTVSKEDYTRFIERVQEITQTHGKQAVGWEEVAAAKLLPTTVVQPWKDEKMARAAAAKGAKVILSPANKLYLDMKYTPKTGLGQNWSGYIEVKESYDWDPANLVGGVAEQAILGVEAPLWTETIRTYADVEYMVFPRIIGCAEIGWSSKDGRNWTEYARRLASHGPRLTAMEVNFYRSPQISWE